MPISKSAARTLPAPPRTTVRGSADFVARVRSRMNELLGLNATSDSDLLRSVLEGLPAQVMDRLQNDGLKPAEIYFIIPPRTLSHRKSRNEPLDISESDRVVRTARILAVAETTFGERDKAHRWLRAPKKRFSGKAPLDMLISEIGARQVEDLLTRIDEGYFA